MRIPSINTLYCARAVKNAGARFFLTAFDTMDWRDQPAMFGTMACVAVLLLATACSPAHNWRDVRHEGVPLQALLPCKPERAERDIPLLGVTQPHLRLQMMSCDVGVTTFALAAVQLPSPATGQAMQEALVQWRLATWSSLKQTPSADGKPPAGWRNVPCRVAGASWSDCWEGPGVGHTGRPLGAQVRWLSRGPWLVQAAAYGEALDKAAIDTYFESLKYE